MNISLPNVHKRGKMRTLIRKRRKIRATRRIRNSQRRSLMGKLMSVKNGTQVMRVPSEYSQRRSLMTWKP
jgi:hypothetical protein